MRNSQESHPSASDPSSYILPQKNLESTIINFSFLQKGEKTPSTPLPFFSRNGLCQDVIEVTQAEPDIGLEVFPALYHTLWPQINSQSDISFKDAWTKFIGGSVFKGSLCPPEKLMAERKVRDLKRTMSGSGGESQIFHDLDGVIASILNLKQKIDDYSGEILYRKEIRESLTLLEEFYQGYRNKIKTFLQAVLEKEQMNASSTLESDALEDLLEPKAVMMGDIFAHHWAYRISRNQAQKLLSLDMNGRNLKGNPDEPSNHRVTSLPENTDEPLVFFKANGNPPIQPEKEFMLYSLYQHLQIPVPETALLILTNVFLESPEYFYAVQASEAVVGEPVLKALRDPEATFDHEAYISQTIGAFLANPSDGSLKNFKYSPVYQTFISLNNHFIFKPEVIGKDEKKTANVKSMLYLFSQIDLPVPDSLKTFFMTLDPHLTILSWLQDLSQKNKKYELLFERLIFQRTRSIYQNLLPQMQAPSLTLCLQQKVYVDPELHGESFHPSIFVSKNLLENLTDKLFHIEKVLSNNRSASTQVLFEEISALLGKYYRKLRLEFSDPEEALEAFSGKKKNSVDYSYISSLLDSEELSNLLRNENDSIENQTPETFFQEYKDLLVSPLDGFIKRHSQRKNKKRLDFRAALKELRLLVQEGLTDSQSTIEIVDFCHSISKIIDKNHHITKEIISILSNLPHPELKWLFTLKKYFMRADHPIPKHLESSSLTVSGALMKDRIFLLTESEREYIFDEQENIRKNFSLSGRSNVTFFPEAMPEFYLKQYPEWPGYEFASTLFMRLLGVKHLPYQDLIIIKSYPTLLTQKISGNPVLRIWNDPQAFQNLDPFHTALLIISAMLINPEDGKEDNFILSSDGKYLIPIDNDHCFLPSFFQKEGGFWNPFTVNTVLQTKTLLFCLDEMNLPIPFEVQQHILSIDFDLLLLQWMNELDLLEAKLNNLADQNQRNEFLEQGTAMGILFYKQFIQNIHWKAHKIQDILKTISHATPFEILKAVEPFAAKCYENSFKQGHDLQSRFKAATNNLYKKTEVDGSRVSILNTRMMISIISASEKDLQNNTIFKKINPGYALELLNQLIQERNEANQELLYELDEKKQEKKWLNLFGDSTTETALKTFLANPKEGLVLTASKLIYSSKLTELFLQAPNAGVKIRFLSLTESPYLSDKEIRVLADECPNLEYLNVSGCMKLKQLITAEKEWPLLSRLETKNCLNLEKFISYSPIKVLRIETDRKVEIQFEQSTLHIFTISKKINGFEFSLKKGEDLEIRLQGQIISNKNFLFSVLSGQEEQVQNYFTNFKIILKMPLVLSENAIGAYITSLDLKNSNLEKEDIQRITKIKLMNLKKLDLSQNKQLGTTSFRSLIRGDWPKLLHLDLSSNKLSLEGLKVLCSGKWPLLEILHLSSTNMTAAGIEILADRAKWPRLKSLSLSGNHHIGDKGLETLSQIDWPLLETLNLCSTGTTKKRLEHFMLNTKCLKLNEILVYSNKDKFIQNLCPNNWPKPEGFDLSDSEITHHEIEILVTKWSWPQLKLLYLSGNKINDKGLEILSQGNWPSLTTLALNKTNITELGVEILARQAKWPALKYLDLSENEINNRGVQGLTQGNWPKLEVLNLKGTNMTTAGVEILVNQTDWPQLVQLNLSENEIDDDAIEILSQSNWPLLEKLDLSYTKITKKKYLNFVLNVQWPNLEEVRLDSIGSFARRALLQKNWSLLEDLNLRYGEITQSEIELMVTKCNWPHFRDLNISFNNILDSGIEVLSRGNWPKLQALDLRKTNMTAVGVKMIVDQANWPWLKSLFLSENEIKDEGIKILSQGNWPKLEVLNLKGTNMTGAGLKTIAIQAKWLDLRDLNISENTVNDDAVKVFSQGYWPCLQVLNLSSTNVTVGAIQYFFSEARWSNLKVFDSENIIDEERRTLAETMCSNIFS